MLPTTTLAALLHPWTWRMAWRDSRSQRRRLAIFAASIVAGIAALVALHLLRATLQTGLETQAKALLGSDLHISSREPFTAEARAALVGTATQVSEETSFSSMLYFPGVGNARLVQVRAVAGGYPYYGKVETVPPGAWKQLPQPPADRPGILVEPTLLDQFDAKIGDLVKLGATEFRLLGTTVKPPPTASRFGGFAPEVFIRLADLESTGLLRAKSLAFYNLHLQLPGDPEPRAAALRARYQETLCRFETPANRREAIGDSLDQAQQFLALIALAALILGALGVAGAIHAHVSRRVASVAILRCLGCPANLAFAIYLAQAFALGLAGALVGAALGLALHTGLLELFRSGFPVELDLTPSLSVVLQTTAAGLAICLGFALGPLLRIREIPPAAALREGAGARSPARLWWLGLLLLALVYGLNLRNGFHGWRAVSMTAALAVAFALLAATARLLTWAARRVPRPTWPYLLRQGVANLHRPHNQTLLFLLSLGLGTFLLLTVLLARQQLLGRLGTERFAESPSVYLVDVQPDQVDDVAALLRAQNLPVLESAPLITMRIQSVRGTAVRDLEKTGAVPKWVLQREFRSTFRADLTGTEKLVAGEWHRQLPANAAPDAPIPLSLEAEIAKDLHVSVGDEMVLDVQGVPIKARVTSLRAVDWSRFTLNFFMVFPPGSLEGAPGFHVLTSRLPAGASSGTLQRALVTQFPNISTIDLAVLLETVRGILEKVVKVVTVLAAFTVLAALPILIGTLLNGRDQRLRESVLLRTLGASARQVRIILAVEYATLGALAALTGTLLALAANTALAVWVFQASPWPSPVLVVSTLLAGTALSLAAGLALSRGASRHAPLEVLRQNLG